ncbi:hypothetical protein CPB83DRAFT_853066 [Crepidotus variabilis]|uniref:Uncharacterized protein n=1 Tax=Crepidotus variabilis TaxID=179855 RepID=A0A9P6EI49_9AGAR|nr:hypothetical protein CPB83DRAFT_853066 [Crepidotus variabilis]
MASCQTWATSTHFRHPWLDSKSMKRKRPEVFSAEEDLVDLGLPLNTAPTSTVPLPTNSSKRRRYTNLENGFAHLTLSGTTSLPHTPISNDIRIQEVVCPPVMDAEMSVEAMAPLSYVVEEPSIPDVKMKTSSWYEPEPDRIVITDLDSFTEEDEDEEQPVTVNTSLLEKIRSLESPKVPLIHPASNELALILFRPPPRFGDLKEETEDKEKDEQVGRDHIPQPDEDAMDVEP